MLKKNSVCWCGSNKKYKNCHEQWDNTISVLKLQGKKVPPHSLIKNEEDIKWIKKAAKINNEVLDLVGREIKAGMSTEEIDILVHDYTVSHGGIPACLGYEGFPKSCCTSINDEVCHGIPDKDIILQEGDIINVDCTTIVHGHYADASRMFCIGQVSPEAKKLVDVTKECMEAGIKAVRPWGYFGDIGAAIQEVAYKNGYSVVTDFCGHGVGNDFHEDPYVHHVGIRNTGMVIAPGMVFTIEPMINEGKRELFIDADNGWTAYTEDGLLSAQWENTIYVTEKGIEILAY
ncbi:MAG: type I methionyl aminopeptidase [Erysipelotrichaceae bacterium]|uniref:type I methionyl aminopeptidase n=1 Tax=Floccifex sp. TaxID=2815810 RepID=UPI002A7531D2|nr:type I methionyl aminopeptidase [Floccifex sp.]MDD7282206.1 type I methionyl aminopeptidase [Erysipelotrichaceae bacterium]MDY2958435.1 type I methionyl aminopeptidase [Floccifex sp.]